MTEATTWYQEGLRFECTQCGNCCSGPPGAVWVTEDDVRAIADFRDISLGEMKINHTKLLRGQLSLREFANGDCTFLDGQTRRCTIYPVRPAQCRTWPFWNSNLQSAEAWEKARQVCPGMGNGALVPLEIIRQQASVVDI